MDDLPPWDAGTASEPDEQVVINQIWDEVRRFMWNTSGLSEPIGVCSVLASASTWFKEIQTHYWDFKLTGEFIELRNLATVAELVVERASGEESWPPHEHRLP